MFTDGGGYMLISRMNSSVTWTVPSSNIPIEPYGEPHLSSYLGDTPLLDVRIQMAIYENLSKTIAHWQVYLCELLFTLADNFSTCVCAG